MKIHNKRELQDITTNQSADIDNKDSFLTNDTTLPADNPLRFRKNLLIPYKNDTD